MNYTGVIGDCRSLLREAEIIANILTPENPQIGDLNVCGIFREIFDNPFDPVVVRSKWWTKAVRQVGLAIYEKQDFDSLPVLADALEEAGCDDSRLLRHLRKTNGHYRGCWALDMVRETPAEDSSAKVRSKLK